MLNHSVKALAIRSRLSQTRWVFLDLPTAVHLLSPLPHFSISLTVSLSLYFSLSLYAGNCRLSRISSRGNINYLSASIFLPNSYLKGKQKRAEVREIFFKLFISSSPLATIFSSCRMLCTARTANKGICHAFKIKGRQWRGETTEFLKHYWFTVTLFMFCFHLSTQPVWRGLVCMCFHFQHWESHKRAWMFNFSKSLLAHIWAVLLCSLHNWFSPS